MNFTGFSEEDFETFHLDGLEDRMEAIRERIQPKFKEIGNKVSNELSDLVGTDIHVHIAQHARRSVNPPNDTWMAFCHNKRGYKKHPHFQIGLFDDHVFIWLAYIYELPNKSEIAQHLLEEKESILETVPASYVVSLDHMKKESTSIQDIDLEKTLIRFRDVKKGEFLIGRQIDATDPVLKNGDEFINLVKETYETLAPLYKMSFNLNY